MFGMVHSSKTITKFLGYASKYANKISVNMINYWSGMDVFRAKEIARQYVLCWAFNWLSYYLGFEAKKDQV